MPTVQTEALKEVSALMAETKAALDRLVKVTGEAAAKEEGEVQATYYHTEVVPAMDALRTRLTKLGIDRGSEPGECHLMEI